MIVLMGTALLDEAAELLEKANTGLSPELCSKEEAKRLLRRYAHIEKLAAFGKAALARRVGDAAELARATGTSMGRAHKTIETARRLAESAQLGDAARHARVSLDQAEVIAKTEALCPGSADLLLEVAQTESFHALKEKARTIRLQAQAGPGLADQQRRARGLWHRVTDLGMIRIEAELEPQVGTPIVNRLEARARRLARSARRSGRNEPFERHLADALPALLSGDSNRPGRPELVVLVSHQVAKRGWRDVGDGEVCKIPGIGPIAPQAALQIARDAFLTGVFYDGNDLRHLKRWTRSIPTEIRIALELGRPPEFDGIKCVDCGHRFRIEIDHLQPHAAGGSASTDNLEPRCDACHLAKTEADRKSGRLRPGLFDERAPPRP